MGPQEAIQLKIVLEGTRPKVWRRVLVHPDITLHWLHRIIQLMFEWYDYHLYEFSISGVKYQAHDDPEATGRDSLNTRLWQLKLREGTEFSYRYDFGDGWYHSIKFEKRKVLAADSPLPYVVAGKRRGPPEDCGGISGFDRLMRTIKNPRNPEHKKLLNWIGPDYSPDTFDLQTVRHSVLLVSAWEFNAPLAMPSSN